jgi:hypothetical protein
VQNSDAYDFSLIGKFLSLCTDAGRVRPSTRTLFAFSRRGPCIPSAFGTWPSHALHQVHKQGYPSSLALSSRGKKARDSGHSPFRGPARRRSPRARISILAPFQRTGSSPDSRSFVVSGAVELLRWFQFQPLRHLGAEADFEVTSVDPHSMQDAGELARDSYDRAQHA